MSAGIIAILVLMVVLIPGKTIASKQSCVKNCPKEITIADNGKMLTYEVGRRFSLVLNRYAYSPEDLRCAGDEIMEKIADVKDLYPNQMQRFLLKNAGSCQLQNKDFKATIIVVAAQNS